MVNGGIGGFESWNMGMNLQGIQGQPTPGTLFLRIRVRSVSRKENWKSERGEEKLRPQVLRLA